MTYRDRALDNPINWSFRIGRLFGIDIRIHILFVLCVVVLVAMEVPKADSAAGWPLGRVLMDALFTYALLFAIVLLHEFGHCFGARYTGGEADEILLWPLGGLALVHPPHKAIAHLITAAAGPMVNVILCAICSLVLVMWLGSLGAVPWNPIHPFWPVSQSIVPTTAQWWLIRLFGLNYLLLLFNLLPIYPFDGGRVAQSLLWPRKGYYASMLIATATGMIGAVVLALFGLFLESHWLLLMIAVFGYITCWQTRQMVKEQGQLSVGTAAYGFLDGYAMSDGDEKDRQKKPGFFERRREKKAARKAELERKRRQEHEKAVEEALRRVSESGIGSLTPHQRRILEEETRRRRSVNSKS